MVAAFAEGCRNAGREVSEANSRRPTHTKWHVAHFREEKCSKVGRFVDHDALRKLLTSGKENGLCVLKQTDNLCLE
jgi:hypothetical protein